MKKGPLEKYKIGLAVLGLFALVLLMVVLLEAGPTKQDSSTYDQANTIANNLDAYIEDNNNVPSSLAEANIFNVPATITYQKLSDSTFKFCVDYKTASSGFDASEEETNLVTDNFGQNGGSDGFGTVDNQYLIISPNHSKGENCQVINALADTGSGTEVYNNNST